MKFGGPYIMSANTRAEASYQRQQSLDMRCREWESRAQPIPSWETLMLRGAAGAAAIALIWWLFDLNWLIVAVVALGEVLGDRP